MVAGSGSGSMFLKRNGQLEVRNDNLLAVYRPCAGFYYNSMDMPGGGSDVQEVEVGS